MTSHEELTEFVRLYHRDRETIEKQATAGIIDQRRDADSFHRELKSAIGQQG